MTIEVRWGSATHVGCVRTSNQDSILAGPVVFAVADGMGGHAAGDVASAIAVARMAALPAAPPGEVVLDAVRAANAEVIANGSPGSGREGMGTTLSALVIAQHEGEESILVVNVGDSRTYKLDAHGLTQVTADHSLVAELVRDGGLSSEQAARHPERNVVTRALGIAREVQVDHWWVRPEVGQVYLMCSDGLTNEVPLAEVERVLRSEPMPQAAVDVLIGQALDAGARDNVSAVAVVVDAVTVDASVVEEDTNRRAKAARPPATESGIIDAVPGAVVEERSAASAAAPTLVTGLPSPVDGAS